VINVGGLKVLPAEVESAALSFPGVRQAKAKGASNPLTGMHVELLCQPGEGVELSIDDLRRHLGEVLPPHARPLRIRVGSVPTGHRFKQV
jgi:acyl-CoA synthetase (AMP-forming)/AMP-acid ligase II